MALGKPSLSRKSPLGLIHVPYVNDDESFAITGESSS